MGDPGTDREALRRDDVYGTTTPLADRASLYDFLERPQDIVDWVLEFVADVPAGETVLDVGCGPGNYAARLDAAGRSVLALDLSPGMAAAARSALGRSAVTVGDVQALPFRDGAVAAVLAPHMLYHPPDIPAAVRELARVLRPGGVLVALTNSARHLEGLWDTVMQARAELARKLSGGPATSPNEAAEDEVLHDLDGSPYERYRPSSDRFNLENGEAPLAACFTVERHVLRNRLVVPESGPTVRYVQTVRPFFEGRFSRGVPWDELVADVARRVQDVIDRDGAWTDVTESGVFVCRSR